MYRHDSDKENNYIFTLKSFFVHVIINLSIAFINSLFERVYGSTNNKQQSTLGSTTHHGHELPKCVRSKLRILEVLFTHGE